MEVENGSLVEETSLVGNRVIFHFHDYYGRKSGLCQDFLKPVAIFEQIDGSHLHDFKYATLDASELPISWYGCYIPGASQPEVDTLPHESQEVFYIPQMIFFITPDFWINNICGYSTNPNLHPLRNKGLIFGLKGKTNGEQALKANITIPLMEEIPANQLRLVAYPITYRVW